MGGIQAMPKSMWLIAIEGDKVHNAYTNYLFKMVSINVGSKDYVLLQQFGQDVFKKMWTQQHASNFKKFWLVAEMQEVQLMTDEW